MGNNNSHADSLHYEAKNWQEVERSVFHEVMRNINNGQEAHLYHFNIKQDRQLDDEIETYYRRRSAANWVQVLGANVTSGGFGFCGTQENANVLTERIPVLLNSIPRLNKQQSLVVLYNALRGFSDVSRIVTPGNITDKMIGFTPAGQTKVWVNENFGMNYPTNYNSEASLNENQLLVNLANAISPRTDLPADFWAALRGQSTINGALNWVKTNGGIAENILNENRINIANYIGQKEVSVLKDTAPIQGLVEPKPLHCVPPTRTVDYVSTGYVQPVNTGYRNPSVNFAYNPQPITSNFIGTSSTYQPVSYQVPTYQPVGTSKFSFTGAQ